MITDVLIIRYRNIIWGDLPDDHRRMIHQLSTIIFDDALHRLKFRNSDGKKIVTFAYRALCKELGVDELLERRRGDPYFGTAIDLDDACRLYLRTLDIRENVDTAVKKQLSLAELLLRAFENVAEKNGQQGLLGRIVEEVNKRAEMNRFPFRYSAGMFHLAVDPLLDEEVDDPFWPLLRAPKWANVVTDIKEAIDLRDNNGRDPAFYAARSLESAIKIISDHRGVTHGREKGAHNYIDNIVCKKSGPLIESWEADLLKNFFSNVRNPLGHGPGNAAMPSLTSEQTDFALAFCMAWIRSLVRRM
jgi:hypothetical protein